MTFRRHYWSCGPIAAWIYKVAGTKPKLSSGTMEEWADWKDDSTTNHPIAYWLAEEGLNMVQNFVNWPMDQLDKIRTYLRNRFVTKTHIAPTRLERGVWHETETRMMHSMFQLLVDFVEVEKAHMMLWSHSDLDRPWWKRFRFTNWGEFRSNDLGWQYLEWERSLTMSTEMGGNGGLSHQATAAEETMALYAWWTTTRPNRADPWEFVEAEDFDFLSHPHNNRTKEQHDAYKKAIDEANRLEKAYEDEDTEMMLRLVNLRRSLWT